MTSPASQIVCQLKFESFKAQLEAETNLVLSGRKGTETRKPAFNLSRGKSVVSNIICGEIVVLVSYRITHRCYS